MNAPVLKNGAVPVTNNLMHLLEPVASFAVIITTSSPALDGLPIHVLCAVMTMKADAAVLSISHV